MQKFTFLRPNLRFLRRVGYLLLSLTSVLLISLLVPQNQSLIGSLMTSKAVAQTTDLTTELIIERGVTGIIGGVPQNLRGQVRYAQLSHQNGITATVPVNGTGNYILYYTSDILGNTSTDPNLSADKANFLDPTSDTFFAADTYQVQYLDGLGNLVTDPSGCDGSPGSCLVTYAPDTDPTSNDYYTQTFTVPGQPVNPLPDGFAREPLGIYGFVTSAATGQGIPNATVTLSTSTNSPTTSRRKIVSLLTNGNGFYTFYYTGTTGIKDFLAPGSYRVQVASADGFNLPPLPFPTSTPGTSVTYIPQNSFFPDDNRYYVSNASNLVNFSLTPQ